MRPRRPQERRSAGRSRRQTAGPAVYIQDYGYNTPRYANVMLMAKSAAVADAAGTAEAAPNLEFEKIRIEHSVTVRFLLN